MRRTLAFAFLLSVCSYIHAQTASQSPHILPGSKVFIEPMNGFETDLAAAFMKKHVPVVLVDNEKNATYVINGSNQDVKAGWAKTIFFTPAPAEHANITVKDPTDGQIVYAYAWDKVAARKGSQSAAEGIAKHLKQFIDQK